MDSKGKGGVPEVETDLEPKFYTHTSLVQNYHTSGKGKGGRGEGEKGEGEGWPLHTRALWLYLSFDL